MKHIYCLILGFVISLMITGCGADDFTDSGFPEGFDGIISSSGSSQLSRIIFTMDLSAVDSSYLLADSLYDVEIYLNNKLWGTFTSAPIDTLAYISRPIGDNLVTDYPVDFLFVTNDQSTVDTLRTAGDYSRALRELLSIVPGDYIAEVRSVSWVDNAGNPVTRPVRDLIPFKLEPSTNTLFIGNFNPTVRL